MDVAWPAIYRLPTVEHPYNSAYNSAYSRPIVGAQPAYGRYTARLPPQPQPGPPVRSSFYYGRTTSTTTGDYTNHHKIHAGWLVIIPLLLSFPQTHSFSSRLFFFFFFLCSPLQRLPSLFFFLSASFFFVCSSFRPHFLVGLVIHLALTLFFVLLLSPPLFRCCRNSSLSFFLVKKFDFIHYILQSHPLDCYDLSS